MSSWIKSLGFAIDALSFCVPYHWQEKLPACETV